VFDSEWLDIAIGVVFVWFLFALLVSGINELGNRIFSIRSKQLWYALNQILDGKDGKGITKSLIGFGFTWLRKVPFLNRLAPVQNLAQFDVRPKSATASIPAARNEGLGIRLLYGMPSVKTLDNHQREDRRTRISHLPEEVFSQAIVELGVVAPDQVQPIRAAGGAEAAGSTEPTSTVPAAPGVPAAGAPAAGETAAGEPAAGGSAGEADPGQQLLAEASATIDTIIARLPNQVAVPVRALWRSAEGRVDVFRRLMEEWFDAQMARLSAIYRAQVRWVLLGIGIIIAFVGFALGFRVDALRLVSDLQRDATLRTYISGVASQTTDQQLSALGCPPATTTPGQEQPTTTAGPATSLPAAEAVVCQVRGLERLKEAGLILDERQTGSDIVPSSGQPSRIEGDENEANAWERAGLLVWWNNPNWWRRLLGVTITAVALSFGASFWYNVLRRLVGLRQGGKSTASSS
jgi:hypothetical protein